MHHGQDCKQHGVLCLSIHSIHVFVHQGSGTLSNTDRIVREMSPSTPSHSHTLTPRTLTQRHKVRESFRHALHVRASSLLSGMCCGVWCAACSLCSLPGTNLRTLHIVIRVQQCLYCAVCKQQTFGWRRRRRNSSFFRRRDRTGFVC